MLLEERERRIGAFSNGGMRQFNKRNNHNGAK